MKSHNYHGILLMATCGIKKWGDLYYRIAVHGLVSKKNDTPHIHIYLYKDPNYDTFNFAVSLVDILCKDEINLIYQKDQVNNIIRTHQKACSWIGYTHIYNGFKEFLTTPPKRNPYINYENGLQTCIEAYNNESNCRSDALKEYLDEKGLVVLPKYAKHLEE